MTSKTIEQEKTTGANRKTRRVFSARMKCEAVLSIWAERRKPAEVCKELGIKWTSLRHWQDRALSAMMEVLEPRSMEAAQQGPALTPKLEQLLERAQRRMSPLNKLQKRLERLQTTEPPPPPPAKA